MPRTFPAQTPYATMLTWVMEALVVSLTMLAAWPFGSVHPFFQWILLTGVAILLACWGSRAILLGRPLWTPCPITLVLAAMCVLAMVQVLPLGANWVEFLSPETAALQRSFAPSVQDMPDEAREETASGAATLSLSPGITRRRLLQLIAVLALFCVVRNNLRDQGCLYRLAWLASANGVLLTVVGFGQMTSSASNTIFWSIPTKGQVFSTFICRNHFAYYLNLCIGLSVGLLLGTRSFLPALLSGRRERSFPWRDLLRDHRAMFLASALGIMLTGLLFSLSRGGVLGLMIGGIVGFLTIRSRHATRWHVAGLVFLFAAVLVFWLGYDRVSQRWEKLWEDNVHGEARAVVWARTLPLTMRFPLFGTGLGTFSLIEPSTREPGDPYNILYDHAHNDFLELLIEGGILQIALAGLVIALIFRKGIEAVALHGPTATGRLAAGGLMGFTAIVVHSFADFGLHVPAVSLFTAVVAALLANLAELNAPDRIDPSRADPSRGSYVRTIAAALQAITLAGVAVFFIHSGRADEQAERFRLASLRAPDNRRVNYLRAAVAHAPDRADIHLALVDVLLARWQHDHERQQRLFVPTFVGTAPQANLAALVVLGQPAPLGWSAEADLQEAWRHVMLARQLSPLDLNALEKASRLTGLFGNVDKMYDGLAQLRRLSPSDPLPWYWAGRRALEQHDNETACRYWRNALLRTNRYLPDIAAVVPDRLSGDQFLEKVLPPDPALIVQALDDINSRSPDAVDEKRYLSAALAHLTARPDSHLADDSLLRARIHARLGEVAEASKSYEAALAARPVVGWRFEYCEYLSRVGLYERAEKELVFLLSQDRHNSSARTLQLHVLRKISEGTARQPPGKS